MKKTLFFAAALVAALAANAQTFVTTIEDDYTVIPSIFTSDGQGRLLFYNNVWTDEYESDILQSQIEIRNNQLQVENNVTITFPTYTNVWIEERQTGEDTWDTVGNNTYERHNRMLWCYYYNLSDGFYDVEYDFSLTQSLFNSDADYEYLLPEWNGTYSYEYSYNWEEYSVHYRVKRSKCQSIAIKKTNGTTVGTISAPQGYSFYHGGANIIKLGSNLYIVLSVRNISDGNESSAWYRIDQQSQSVNLVDMTPMSVRPSVVKRGQDITVELGDGMQASELEVVNALGQIVKRVPVQPGQREVRIGTADLGHGINLINSRKQGTVKIIVK